MSRLESRVEALEATANPTRGPVILLDQGESHADGLTRHRAKYGVQNGEPFFIELVALQSDGD